MKIELVRMGIVYFHLLACCVAIGLVLISDIDMVKQLLHGGPDNGLDPEHLEGLQKTVSRALLALWVTGVALVSLDAYTTGWGILDNPKLQAKITIVALLTLNGIVLHNYVLPRLQQAGSLLRLAFGQRMLALFIGSVSGVSWLYAAMLGVGRPLSWKYSLFEILLAYPVLIGGGFMTMALLTAWAQRQANPTTRD